MFAALSSFHVWASKRERLLAGVVGVAVKTASACVPGVSLAAEILGQLAEKAAEDVLDPETHHALSREQLAQFKDWMASLSRNYAGLLDRLEQMPLADGGTLEQLTRTVELVWRYEIGRVNALIYSLRNRRDNWKRKYSSVKNQLSNLQRCFTRLAARSSSASAPPF